MKDKVIVTPEMVADYCLLRQVVNWVMGHDAISQDIKNEIMDLVGSSQFDQIFGMDIWRGVDSPNL